MKKRGGKNKSKSFRMTCGNSNRWNTKSITKHLLYITKALLNYAKDAKHIYIVLK
jgi:predicted Zn-dependent protease